MKRFILLVICLAGAIAIPRASAQKSSPFYFQSYMGRCLDYGPPPQTIGSPVFVYGCNRTAAQQVGIEEIPSLGAHQVRLHAGSLCIGTDSNTPAAGSALTLEACGNQAGEIFALDGDSILLDSNLDLAVQLKGGVTKSRTALVLGARMVSDFELWDAVAVDGSTRRPTSGFVSVSTPTALQQALANAGPGTVIELPAGADISFSDLPRPFPLSTRVTIRGDRRGGAEGPQITLSPGHDNTGLFITYGDHVRLTGLRLRGAGRDPGGSKPRLKGINGTATYNALIDHNDLSDWTTSAIDLNGSDDDDPNCPPSIPVRSQIVRILRNFIHDNSQVYSDGYGVVSGSGSNPFIFGNMFQKNYHSISSDGSATSAYSAVSNLIMPGDGDTDLDMHGYSTNNQATHAFGGVGGIGVEALKNTFLGTDKTNFGMRGTPCSGALDTFYGNVAVRDISGSVAVVPDGQTGQSSEVSWTSVNTRVSFLRVDSRFSMPNPTQALLVGDFDGDGKDDLFMATGSGWYYSPAGNAEWRFLSAKTETVGSLLLGDFDGDGRADVFTQIGDKWLVSWGGRSDWQSLSDNHGGAAINPANTKQMVDFAIGDFVGDGRSDVFYADGKSWWVSDGGVGPLTFYATSSYKLPDILFGDFDGDGKTDVAGVVDHQWMFVPANGPHSWTPLRAELTNTMAGLIAADFDGDGKTDIAQLNTSANLTSMRVSVDGRGDWQPLNRNTTPSSIVAVGRFDNAKGSDILIWTGSFLSVLSHGSGSAIRQSRQDMR
jgi:hypothetical protein